MCTVVYLTRILTYIHADRERERGRERKRERERWRYRCVRNQVVSGTLAEPGQKVLLGSCSLARLHRDDLQHSMLIESSR